MKYFILWCLFIDGSYQPVGTYTTLQECKVSEYRMGEKAIASNARFMYTCLPEGTYPKAPEGRQ